MEHSDLESDILDCIPFENIYSGFTEAHGDKIQEIIEIFVHDINETRTSKLLIVKCRENKEYLCDIVAKRGLSALSTEKRQAFACSCLIMAYSTVHSRYHKCHRIAVGILDLAMRLGEPFRNWDIYRALHLLLERGDLGYGPVVYDDNRRLSDARASGKDAALDRNKWKNIISMHSTSFYRVRKLVDVFPDDIPKVLQLYEAELRKEYFNTGPVKFTGVMAEWPASIKWDYISYLKRLAGYRIVPVELGEYTASKLRFFVFADYLDALYAGKTFYDIGYLAQEDLFFVEPKLRNDVVPPPFSRTVATNVWIGPRGTFSPLHRDPEDNLLYQVIGSKAVFLFNPWYSPYMYPREDAFFNTSQVDILNIDHKKYPLFSKAKPMICILNPSEVLFIPRGWWHAVLSLDVAISVNFFIEI